MPTPRTLGELLGELPSGKVVPYSLDEAAKHIREAYINDDREEARRANMRARLDLYHDRGDKQLDELLTKVFSDSKVLELRRAFIPYSQFQNVTKRVVQEISTVYSERATRYVGDGDDRYQQLLLSVKQDRVLRKVNRYVNLLNECFVMFRVGHVDRKPRLDVITPDRFFAVAHPLEPTTLVAVVFHSAPAGVKDLVNVPHWTVWSDREVFCLNGHGEAMSETYLEHGYGMMPGMLVHREIPDSCILDGTSGGDLMSAHKAVALLNVMMMKEQKSGTKLPYVSGDIGQTAMGQAADSENLAVFEEGISPGSLDMGSDPRTYIDAVRSVIKQVAANYGIPESVFDLSYQASSGFEIELKRVGLREKRRDQIIDWRENERELVQIQAAVTGRKLGPAASFTPEPFGVDFGEVETPKDPMQMLAYWRELKRHSLGNTVDFAMELNPEFDAKQAKLWIQQNVELETERVALMKQLMQLNGGVMSEVEEPAEEEDSDE